MRLTLITPLLLLLLCGCVATPLSRSYDDPYVSPLPNETAPPSLSSSEESCHRDPINGCNEVCVSDSDCADGEICVDSQCLPDRLSQPERLKKDADNFESSTQSSPKEPDHE